MFLRETRRYNEVLEAYRDPATGRSTNRCIARWPLGQTLDAAMGAVVAAFEAQLVVTTRKGGEKNHRRLARLQRQYDALCRAWAGLPRDAPLSEETLRRVEILQTLQAVQRELAAAAIEGQFSGVLWG